MIIKNDSPKSSFFKTAIILLCSIGGLYGVWYFLPHWSSWKKEGVIFCDAEVVRGGSFISAGHTFDKAKTQSDDFAFEGNFSSKVLTGEGFQYGFGFDLNKIKEGKSYQVSVWQKSGNPNTAGTLVVKDKSGFINQEITNSSRQKNGWELLETKFSIPFQKGIKNILIYVRTSGKEIAYFDNLKIEELKDIITHLPTFQPDVLQIEMSNKAFQKIQNKRKEALQIGILQTEENDWVNGTLFSKNQNESMPIEMRLKGDWLDHLKGNKWSFRVKVKDPMAWNRLKTFSLQSPPTRNFLEEWMLHYWWDKEDVLTPRYDFVELQLNGQSLGVYAYEEHFEKQIPEFNERREGVIVRFSEDGFWADVKLRMHDLEGNPIAHVNNSAALQSSEIKPFNEKEVLENPVLKKQLETARQLLLDFLENKKPIAEIFDLKKTAKYFAICDLMQAQHSAVWHNMRFYYNPVLDRLEPIGFDGFPTEGYPFLLMSEGALSKYFKGNDDTVFPFFRDTTFVQQYIYNLFEFSKKEYIEELVGEIENGLLDRTNFLNKEFSEFQYSKKQLENKISGIRSNIFPLNNFTVKAYHEVDENGRPIIKTGNTHSLPVEIIGLGKRAKKIDEYFSKTKILPAFIHTPFYEDLSKTKRKRNPDIPEIARQTIDYQRFNNQSSYDFIFYKVLGTDSVFHTKILNWSASSVMSAPKINSTKSEFKSTELFSIYDKKVIFHSGKYIVTKDVIIPKGYEVEFLEGTELDFQNGAKFLSYSPIKMLGSNDNPIKIWSSDGSANGFTILQAEGISTLRHVVFENMNTHRKDDWLLTGAVTFYESEVDLRHCLFSKNKCEDGLNLIRTNFKMNKCTFYQAPSDGLDLDFCNGAISDSKFLNTTNDGLDVSGSQVYVANCSFDNCGDKGVSVGEESTMTILSARIKNSNIAVASKDLSKLIIEEIYLEKCRQGFTAYQKKVEFGGSQIEVRNYTSKNVDRLYNIANGSRLQLADKWIE